MEIKALPKQIYLEECLKCENFLPVIFIEECENEEEIQKYLDFLNKNKENFNLIYDKEDFEEIECNEDIKYLSSATVMDEETGFIFIEPELPLETLKEHIEFSVNILEKIENEMEKWFNDNLIFINLKNNYINELIELMEFELEQTEEKWVKKICNFIIKELRKYN